MLCSVLVLTIKRLKRTHNRATKVIRQLGSLKGKAEKTVFVHLEKISLRESVMAMFQYLKGG